MPSQVKTTQKAVLEAVLARIRSQVTYVMPGTAAAQSFNETTMFLAWDADKAVAQQPVRNNVWGCVVPLQGSPSDAEFMGGGENDLTEHPRNQRPRENYEIPTTWLDSIRTQYRQGHAGGHESGEKAVHLFDGAVGG